MISPVTRGSWASGGSCVLVDQAVEDGFSADPLAVEAGFGAVAGVMFSLGDVLGDALVRLDHVVVRLILSQHGAQMSFAEEQHAVEEPTAQGADQPLADRVHARSLDGGTQDPGSGGLEDRVE